MRACRHVGTYLAKNRSGACRYIYQYRSRKTAGTVCAYQGTGIMKTTHTTFTEIRKFLHTGHTDMFNLAGGRAAFRRLHRASGWARMLPMAAYRGQHWGLRLHPCGSGNSISAPAVANDLPAFQSHLATLGRQQLHSWLAWSTGGHIQRPCMRRLLPSTLAMKMF